MAVPLEREGQDLMGCAMEQGATRIARGAGWLTPGERVVWTNEVDTPCAVRTTAASPGHPPPWVAVVALKGWAWVANGWRPRAFESREVAKYARALCMALRVAVRTPEVRDSLRTLYGLGGGEAVARWCLEAYPHCPDLQTMASSNRSVLRKARGRYG